MNRLACFAALALLCHVRAGLADAPASSVDHFLILVHPCPYEALGGAETDRYRALERAACRRWFEAIPALPKSTFAVQIDGAAAGPSPAKLHEALIGRLGGGRVVRIGVEFVSPEEPGPLRNYYRRIDQRIRRQMAAQGLSFDPATAKATIWGQSFEGCASGYGSAVAAYLGLKTPTRFDYGMSAPDAPFLLDAKLLKTVDVPNSDVTAYVFALKDGRYAAFFRSRLTPQWLDHRPIRLALDAKRFSVLAKNTGEVLWPNGKTPTTQQLRASRFNQWRAVAWPNDPQAPGPGALTLSTVQERFVVGTSLQELISVIQSAEVKPQAVAVEPK